MILKSIAATTMAALLSFAIIGPSLSQGFARGPRYATVSTSITPSAIAPGSTGVMDIHIAIQPGFHINSAHPKDPDLIPTVFKSNLTHGVTYGSPIFPKDQTVTTSTGKLLAYAGNVNVLVPFALSRNTKAGKTTIGGTLTYQGCNANACFPPKQDTLAGIVTVK